VKVKAYGSSDEWLNALKQDLEKALELCNTSCVRKAGLTRKVKSKIGSNY